MDLHLASAGPFTYLVGEHARAIVAIQELQREVNSLLSFRDHVLEALPHLQLREPPGAATPRPRSHSQTTGGKSLSEGPPTVADSGFSTDKASTSMGKSSSSSSGELSGGRWALGEPPDAAVAPLGSVEDELWTLLEVIERKGSRLRKDLERAEERERELGHASDPAPRHTSPEDVTASPTRQSERWRGPGGDWWPHSLPGAGPRLDFVPGLEAWGEVERLRVDRLYLMGRLQRAEAEGGAAHQRLLDLHGQLLSLAGEKRRLEDAFRVLRGTEMPSQMAPSKGSNKGVTVSVGGDAVHTSRRSSSVRIGDDVFLPRVLKVPIKDKWSSRPPSRIPQGIAGAPAKGEPQSPSPSKTIVLFPSSKASPSEILSPPPGPAASSSGGDRVVIERERSANRVDGGLSMPASLLKGARVKVRPDKQRISAILREKDVLALQKQLLTTVMETEVLRRQLEMAGEEWEAKIADWENDRKRQQDVNSSLKTENTTLKKQLDQIRSIKKVDVGVYAFPSTHNASVGTADEAEIPTFSVHHGPNVKYDVVVYEENNCETLKPTKAPSVALRKPPTVEKPPRRARPLSVGPAVDSTSFGRDSLGKIAKVPLRPSSRTPPATPRSSPAPSMSVPRNPGGRVGSIPEGGSGGARSSLVNGSVRNGFGRRDSLKGAIGNSGTSPGGKGTPSGGTHKNIPVWHHNVNGNIRRHHSQEKLLRSQGSRTRDHPKDSCTNSKSSPQADDGSHDSNDFFDSISDCLPSPQYIGYQKSLYGPHIPYFSPASPLWLPFYTQTLPLHKGRHHAGGNAYLNQRWRCPQEEDSPPSDSLELEYPHFEVPKREARECLHPMENAVRMGFRRKLPSGIIRVKKTGGQRPSVLP